VSDLSHHGLYSYYTLRLPRSTSTTMLYIRMNNADVRFLALSLGPSEAGSEPSFTPSQRYQLEAVVIPIPSRRSKLSTEKTTSIDNLTLPPPQSSPPEESNLPAPSDSPEPKRVLKKARLARPNSMHPFDIGKHSSVRKETIQSLQIGKGGSYSDDELPDRKSRGKGKGKGKAEVKKELTPPDSERLGSDGGDGGDFAMDSDEEDRQLQKALKASTEGQGEKVVPKKTRNNAAALKSAVSRAIKGKPRPDCLGDSPSADQGKGSVGTSTNKGDETPRSLDFDDGLGEGFDAGSDFGASSLSAMSAPSDSESQPDVDVPISKLKSRPKAPRSSAKSAKSNPAPEGKGKATPKPSFEADDSESDFSLNDSDDFTDLGSSGEDRKPKPLNKKPRVKAVFGRKVDGKVKTEVKKDEVEDSDGGLDEGMLAGLDPEMRANEIRKYKNRRDRKRYEIALAPIRAKEKILRKNLGRKLTNGERNQVRLEHVG
jgi:DNA repair protein RAD16